MYGRTGRVMFNDNGDRINAIYNIVNVKPQVGKVEIGTYDPVKSLNVSDKIVLPVVIL